MNKKTSKLNRDQFSIRCRRIARLLDNKKILDKNGDKMEKMEMEIKQRIEFFLVAFRKFEFIYELR